MSGTEAKQKTSNPCGGDCRERVTDPNEPTNIGRIQMILAEKRTSLAVLRSGFALMSVPMSLAAFLIATSKYYDILTNLYLAIPLFTLNTIMVILGAALIQRSWKRILREDKMVADIKRSCPHLSKYIIDHP